MKKWLPIQLGVCLVLTSAVAIVAMVWPELYSEPGVRGIVVIAIVLQLLLCAANAVPDSVNDWLFKNAEEPNRRLDEEWPETEAIAHEPVLPPSCEEMQSAEVQKLLAELDSNEGSVVRHALHDLNERFGQPIMPTNCWPQLEGSRLQRIAAEVLLREWIEVVKELPGADDDEIIERMFPRVAEEPKPRRFRKLREMKRPASPPPLVVRKLDEWSEKVKNAVMDINIGEPISDSFPEGEDKDLLPFDRQRFIDALSGRMHESLDFIADAVGEANTDFELLCNHKKIEPYLTNLSWEAIAIALEHRQAEPEPAKADEIRKRVNEMPTRWLASQPLPARPTEGWARKYRRMKAQGL
jgi:hypothetical protein